MKEYRSRSPQDILIQPGMAAASEGTVMVRGERIKLGGLWFLCHLFMYALEVLGSQGYQKNTLIIQ